jgi:TPR repeat protein
MHTRFRVCVILISAAIFALPALAVLDQSSNQPDHKFSVTTENLLPEDSDPEAQFARGLKYLNGTGVAKDDHAAFIWIQRAAEQGLPEAQASLGVMYGRGYGVAQDEAQAVQWFRKAAENGSTTGQYNLGVAYAKGHGVVQDFHEAVNWFRKAAEQGYASAQFNLGVAYVRGDGVAKNEAEAVKWFRLAASQGNQDARNMLFRMSDETEEHVTTKEKSEAMPPSPITPDAATAGPHGADGTIGPRRTNMAP